MFPVTDPILVFTILALAMLVAPVFSERLRIPDLVLLLIFGAVLGPNGLNIVERNSAVTMLGSVGMIYIMFLAGLEIDLYHFSRSYKRGIGFGLLTFIIPQGLGALAGRFILGMDWPTSILLASMFASHTLLTYPLASRLGIARSEPVVVAVGATIITNTMALLVLAVIADSARGVRLGPAFYATITLGMLALTGFIWRGIPFTTRWFFQRVTEKSNAQFLFVIVTMCGCSYLSHYARTEPIIGAFLAGAAFNQLIPENSPLMNRVSFAGHTLFIPFFLISVGMLVDVRAIVAEPYGMLVSATMVGMVVLTKYMAAHLARRWFGYSRAAGQVMFGLSVVQAAATLAAVVVGYELKIFDEAVLNGAIAMIMVSCPLGAWAVERYGRRMAAEAPVAVAHAGAEQRLLVPVANPESATRLLDLAFLLRNTARPGGIYPLAIARDEGHTDAAVAQCETLLAHCLAHAASADMPVQPGLRVSVNISDGIVHSARELRSSSVLMGWSGDASVSIRIFGTVMHHQVANCASRLMFCRLVCPLNTTKRLLVPFPPQASRRRNLPDLIRDIKVLAQRIGADLRLYAVAGETARLQPQIEAAKPACRMNTIPVDTWENMQQMLFADIRPDDMILLPVDRRNSVLWTPSLENLPERVAKRFPANNLLVAYPSMPLPDQDACEAVVEQDDDFPLVLPIDLNQDISLEQALEQMVKAAFPGQPDRIVAALEHLGSSARSCPVELAPGVVLLHARFGEFEKSLLMVCHAVAGWPLPDLPAPPRVILVLLGSQSQTADQHLRTLSQIANRIHEANRGHQMAAAKDAAEVCTLLSRTTK